jgi:hypothetical protein
MLPLMTIYIETALYEEFKEEIYRMGLTFRIVKAWADGMLIEVCFSDLRYRQILQFVAALRTAKGLNKKAPTTSQGRNG